MDVDAVIAAWGEAPELVHVERVPARTGITEALDPPLPETIDAALAERGIEHLWRHQVAAIRSIRAGADTALVAGTASGKSLAYQLPIAEAIATDHRQSAICIYPTKALTNDQLRSFSRLGVDRLVAVTYDGDTDTDARRWARRNANVFLTNPDMLHVGILPNHDLWKDVLHRLRFVVVDEMHTLRGVFGSHVALVLRRLRRIAARYGADPTFVFTSATIGNPGELAEALGGAPVEVIEQDTSPQGAKTYVLWNPELEDEVRGIRGSPLADATRVFADLVSGEVSSIVFSRSRKGTELMYRWARERLDPGTGDRIAPYRGGYLAEDRRRIEHSLASGELTGVVATNALELGIDIGSLDAAVLTTFPGTIASFRQQAGRAGRTRSDSLAVLVAGQDALDQYYMTHPDQLFSRAVEAAVVNPSNPEILSAHAGCAAAELPLRPEDMGILGPAVEEVAADLAASGDLILRNGGLLWAGGRSPASGVDLRSTGGPPYVIVDDTGELLGHVDEERAFRQTHEGAIHLHQGETYLVEDLDLDRREIRVSRQSLGYYTQPKVEQDLTILDVAAHDSVGRLGRGWGRVESISQVIAYQRKELGSGRVLDTIPLDLPERRFVTVGFWYTVPEDLLDDAGIEWVDVPGTMHAVEHTTIGMMPLFAICDRWDIGGLSTALHPQTGEAVFFVYDGYPGGAGIAPVGHAAGERLLRATLETVQRCPCAAGCPSCVQSPKCGNFNDPLDKDGAAALLRTALP